MSPTLSIIVPMYNESAVIRLFYERVTAAVAPMGVSYELLFVDDGSADDTFEQIHAIADADPHVAALRFSRNFGHQAALFAGMSRAAGEFILMMDGDLQHPPELIPELWQQAQNGFDIVYTIRETSEGAGWFKQFTSRAFYALFSYLTDVRLDPEHGGFPPDFAQRVRYDYGDGRAGRVSARRLCVGRLPAERHSVSCP